LSDKQRKDILLQKTISKEVVYICIIQLLS